QGRKGIQSTTYSDMIAFALSKFPDGKGPFKDICDIVEKEWNKDLNWKLER
ncbi:unnamed protein product, partial [Choristocarpus tenellus]